MRIAAALLALVALLVFSDSASSQQFSIKQLLPFRKQPPTVEPIVLTDRQGHWGSSKLLDPIDESQYEKHLSLPTLADFQNRGQKFWAETTRQLDALARQGRAGIQLANRPFAALHGSRSDERPRLMPRPLGNHRAGDPDCTHRF